MSIQQRLDYLSALIESDLKKCGEIGACIKDLVLEDLKLTQEEWDNLEETHKFVILRATERFKKSLNEPEKE